jgi:hypothetical protein
MIFILVLKGTLGLAAIRQFESQEACMQGAQEYMELLEAQKSDDRHPVQLFCVGVPPRLPESKAMSDA